MGNLQALRADFERRAGRALALPLAGAVVLAASPIACRPTTHCPRPDVPHATDTSPPCPAPPPIRSLPTGQLHASQLHRAHMQGSRTLGGAREQTKDPAARQVIADVGHLSVVTDPAHARELTTHLAELLHTAR